MLRRPLVRADLMSLRVKDLRRYLTAKEVNCKTCVGEGLCNVFMNLKKPKFLFNKKDFNLPFFNRVHG